MTGKQLRNTIRKYRGPIFVDVCSNNCSFWIQAVKSQLLLAVEHIADNELEATERDGALYIGRAY